MTRILIDTSLGTQEKSFAFEQSERIIAAYQENEIENALTQIEDALCEGYYAAGFLSYELGLFFEDKLRLRLSKKNSQTKYKTPLLWFAIFKEPKILNRPQTSEWLESHHKSFSDQQYKIDNLNLSFEKDTYYKAFNKAQTAIASGDIYQLNLTFNSHFEFLGNPIALYQDLKHKQKMAHGAVILTDDFSILSASPELFLKFENNHASTCPMKGTAKRGLTQKQDDEIKEWLSQDKKSQAENLMIVDLMRNDLARISEIGSVHVPELFAIETYPTLHQMTSTVEATLKPDLSLRDWLKALFPSGSITGAPKVRAMELIDDIETQSRGVYTGSIGMLMPKEKSGTQVYFNVAIRTIQLWPDGTGKMGIGSGVVSDSNADAEYDECLLKMRFLTEPKKTFELIETLMFLPTEGYLYYGQHIKRLNNSARFFDFKYSLDDVEKTLEEKAKKLSDPHRVRLLLSPNGQITLTATPVSAPDPNKIMHYVISEQTMHTDNLFLYHKTTNRDFYDNEHKKLSEKYNCDEVIFLNEKQQLTEGSRTNIFIEKDGLLRTPSIDCGVLAGTLRADLLETGKAKEAILTLEDLQAADKVYLGNSVRGLLQAKAQSH